MIRVFIITMCCMTVLLVSMVIGFFVYESQFETELDYISSQMVDSLGIEHSRDVGGYYGS